MNPHAPQPTTPAALGKSLWRNLQLILQMTPREVPGRYKGSFTDPRHPNRNSLRHIFIPSANFTTSLSPTSLQALKNGKYWRQLIKHRRLAGVAVFEHYGRWD